MLDSISNESAVDRLKKQLLEILELIRTGKADLTKGKIPFSVLVSNFAVNQSTLSDEQLDTIISVAEICLNSDFIEIETILGRASQTGEETNNESLSDARAKAVKRELSHLGIYPPPSVEALGSTQALHDMAGLEIGENRSAEIRLWFDLEKAFYSSSHNMPVNQSTDVDMSLFTDAWDTGFENMSDQDVLLAYNEIRYKNLSAFEHSNLHDFLVYTIVNLALEKIKREFPNFDLQETISHAWSNAVQVPLREDNLKDDHNITIYRDAERVLEVANGTAKSTPGGVSMYLVQVGYDGFKSAAWAIYDKTGDDKALRKISATENYASRPGSMSWGGLGARYAAAMNFQNADKPEPLDLPEGALEFAKEEIGKLQP